MAPGRARTTVTIREAVRICLRREHLRRTAKIALVVGVVLT
jgi:hypothetical protein